MSISPSIPIPFEDFQALLKELKRIADALDRIKPLPIERRPQQVTENDLTVLNEEELWEKEIEEEQSSLLGRSAEE